MSTPQDEIWVDMVQFDTRTADAIWDGEAPPDAPRWYGEMASHIRSARRPADPAELADEPHVVDTMRRAAQGEGVTRVRRPTPVRVLGRAAAMKASAVVTVSVLGITAAAATIGTVATVVVPAIERQFVTSEHDHHGDRSDGSAPGPGTGDQDTGGADSSGPAQCLAQSHTCIDPDLVAEPGASRDGTDPPTARSGEPQDGGETDTGAASPDGTVAGSAADPGETSPVDEPTTVSDPVAGGEAPTDQAAATRHPTTTTPQPTTTTIAQPTATTAQPTTTDQRRTGVEQPTAGEPGAGQPTTADRSAATTDTPTASTEEPAVTSGPTAGDEPATDRGAPDPHARRADAPPPHAGAPRVGTGHGPDGPADDPSLTPGPPSPPVSVEPPGSALDAAPQPARDDAGDAPDPPRGRAQAARSAPGPAPVEPPGPPDGIEPGPPTGPVAPAAGRGPHRAAPAR